MGTVKCPLCGTEINEETARCPECGHDPRLPTSSAEVELWEEHGTKTVAQLVPLGTRLAIAAGIAGLIAAVLVVTQGVSWAADMTEYGVGPGVPMIRTGIFWAVAAGVALLAAAAMPNRRWTAVLLALLSTAIGFLGALLAAGPSASDWGAPYWFADPRDHAVLAVLWLPAALLLTAAVLLTLGSCDRLLRRGGGTPASPA
jgi:hypothetical protein